jgi:hypothetical protein
VVRKRIESSAALKDFFSSSSSKFCVQKTRSLKSDAVAQAQQQNSCIIFIMAQRARLP